MIACHPAILSIHTVSAHNTHIEWWQSRVLKHIDGIRDGSAGDGVKQLLYTATIEYLLLMFKKHFSNML